MRWLLAGTLALLAAQLGRSSVVQASCIGPELALLWSYPAAGAEQVPTNIVIWALTSAWSAKPYASLDGNPVDLQGTPTFSGVYLQPQDLAPNSDHTLVLDYSRSPNTPMPGTQTRFEIKFKTGAGPAEGTVAPPAVTGSSRVVTDPRDHDCSDVIAAQDCFDTGQDTLLSLTIDDTQPDETIGWLVQSSYQGGSAIWPARCGAPSVYIHAQDSSCYEVQRIGAGGRLSQVVEHCSKPASPAPAAAGQGGAPSAGSAASLAADAGHSDADSGDAGAPAGGARAPAEAPAADAGSGDAGAPVGGARAPAGAPAADAGCSTVSGARTAARAFWAIVAIALLLAHHQRHHRRRPRGVTPSRRFRI